MPRPLLRITLCVLGGLTAGELALYFPLTIAIGAGVLLLITVVFVRRRGALFRSSEDAVRSRRWLMIGLVFIVLGVGASHRMLTVVEHPPLEPYVERGPVEVIGEVAGFVEPHTDRTVALLELSAITVPPTSPAGDDSTPAAGAVRQPVEGQVRLTIRGAPAPGEPWLGAGDRVRLFAELHRPRGLHNPGLFDSGWYAQRQGIGAVVSAKADRVERLEPERHGIGIRVIRLVGEWRERIRLSMTNALAPETAALLSAMIIGETGGLTPELRNDFTAAGVAHILSISGSHLGLLAGALFLIVRGVCRLLPGRWLLGLTRWLTPTQAAMLATVPAVVFYTLLAGGQVATVRSLLMLLLYSGAVLLHRPHDLLTALAVATLAVLVWDPLATGGISFQLSYGAVLGMALVLEWWKHRDREERDDAPVGAVGTTEGRSWWLAARLRHEWRPWLDRAELYLLLTMAATVMTAPLVAYHFRQLNWVGLLSNLVVPIIGAVLIPLALVCAVGSLFWVTPVFPLAALNDWLTGLLISIVHWFARWPGAVIHLPAPSLVTLVTIYAGMAGLWWFATASHHEWRRLRWLQWMALGCSGLWVVVASIGFVRPDDRLRVTFLDVGQGDAAAVTFPTGETMIVDGGPRHGDYDTGRVVVAPYLWDHRIRRIDYLVATHPQADHIGAQSTLIREFPIGEVWQSGLSNPGAIVGDWQSALAAKSLQPRTIRVVPGGASAPPVRIGPTEIDLLHPSASFVGDDAAPSGHALNNGAIVLRLRYGVHQFLFTADIEKEAERALLREQSGRLSATVIKVPHHGSRTSSSPEFLAAVHPGYAVISVGAHNPYRHPSPQVVEAYEAQGVELLRTDHDGQVVFISDGSTLVRLTAREVELQPVNWTGGVRAEWANYRRLWRRWWWRM